MILKLLCAVLCIGALAGCGTLRETTPGASAVNTCDRLAPVRVPVVGDAYMRRYDTIAHRFLDEERDVAPVTPQMYAVLDSVLDTARRELAPYTGDAASAVRILKAIDCILLRHGFAYPSRGGVHLLADALAPTEYGSEFERDALQTHRHNRRRARFIEPLGPGPFYVADCDTASYLYLAIAEVQGYPLAMVDLPDHNFVRWSLADGRVINFETMTGQAVDDRFYVDGWEIPRRFVDSGAALRSMSREAAHAYHLATVALAWSHKPDIARMKGAYLRAIEIDPTRAFALNNLAWFYAAAPTKAVRDGPRAVQFALRAVEVFPSGDNLHTLACAYAEAGDFARAHEELDRAVAARYTPFGSQLEAERKRFDARLACVDTDFGRDPEPFRPR